MTRSTTVLATIRAHTPASVKRMARVPDQTWRRLTYDRRAMPSFIILGAMRAGTTSLYHWLCNHPDVGAAFRKEIHYFDVEYSRGMNWYRANFPIEREGKITGEASPYMLCHPLAPTRAKTDLSKSTKFIVQLREPVERAVSHYWLERRDRMEPETFERAIALEPERLSGSEERLARGLPDDDHRNFSYVTRGEYAPQLERWFDVIGRERILVLESERLFAEQALQTSILDWLGLSPNPAPFPKYLSAERTESIDQSVLDALAEHFKPFNERLFELLGTRMWERPRVPR